MSVPQINRSSHWSTGWLLVPIVLLLIQVSARPCLEPDSVCYLSMAQSMADHGQMRRFGDPHLVFAFGYPLVLSGALQLQADTFLTVSLLNAVLGILVVLGVWRWCLDVAPAQAVWISCLSVGNVIVLQLFRRPLSEPLFMALLIWSTVLLNRVVMLLPARIDWVSIGLASLLLCLLVSTRQVGVFLVAGYGMWLGLRAFQGTIRWKQAILVAFLPGLAVSLTLGAIILYDQHTKVSAPTHSHWDMLLRKTEFTAEHKEETFLANIVEGLRIRIYEIGRLLIPGMFGCYAKTGQWLNFNTLIYVPVAALTVFGWWRLVRRHPDSLSLMVPWYVALYIVWPCDQGGRFFAPVLPVILLSFWKALALMPSCRKRWIVCAMIIAHAVVALGLWVDVDLRRDPQRQLQREDVNRVVDLLASDRGTIGVDDTLSWPVLYLEHKLNRLASKYRAEALPQYLFWPRQLELPPGYVDWSVGSSYRLAQRRREPGYQQ